MKASCVRLLFGCLGSIAAIADHGSATAASLLIEATANATWRSGGKESGDENTPLVVETKAGDVLEIRVVAGPHGFVTLDKPGNQSPSAALKFVQACGESAQDKPD